MTVVRGTELQSHHVWSGCTAAPLLLPHACNSARSTSSFATSTDLTQSDTTSDDATESDDEAERPPQFPSLKDEEVRDRECCSGGRGTEVKARPERSLRGSFWEPLLSCCFPSQTLTPPPPRRRRENCPSSLFIRQPRLVNRPTPSLSCQPLLGAPVAQRLSPSSGGASGVRMWPATLSGTRSRSEVRKHSEAPPNP